MKKSKILLSSVLAIALCVCLIVGATLALFMGGSKTNIAVTSGEVNIVATAEIAEAWSTEWDDNANGYVQYKDLQRITDGYQFTNKGTVVFEDGTLIGNNISAGDGLRLNVDIVNRSTVKTQYRIEVNTEQDNGLLDGLSISYDLNGDKIDFKGSNPRFTEWMELEKASDTKNGDKVDTLHVEIELPITAGDEYQNKIGNFVITVFAVQWNGDVEDPEPSAVVASTTISEYADANYWNGNGRYTEIMVDDVVTLTTSEGEKNGTYDQNELSWNLYQSENATLNISVPAGYELESFKITYSNNSGGMLRVDSQVVSTYALRAISADYDVESGETYPVSDSNKGKDVTLVVWGDGAGEVHVTDVEVVYRATENEAECEHEWDTANIAWSWAADNSSAKATFNCAKCEKTRAVTAMVSSSVEQEATCTENGKEIYTATVNFEGKTYKDTKEVTLQKLGHDLKDVEKKEATCTESGYEAHKACSRCDYKEDYEEIPATGHSYGEPKWSWTEDYKSATATFKCDKGDDTKDVTTTDITASVEKEASCTEVGKKTYTATVTLNGINYTDKQETEIEKINHKFNILQTSDTEHWYKCESCDETEGRVAHFGGTATHFEKAKCEVCKQEYGTVIAHTFNKEVAEQKYLASEATCEKRATYYYSCECGEFESVEGETFEAGELAAHTLTGHTDRIEATCTAAGNIEYWTCEVCDKNFKDSKGTEQADNVVIEKLGHDWTNVEPAWSWNGDHTVATATFTCAREYEYTESVDDDNPTSSTTKATCEDSSKTTYSAKINFQGKDFATEEVVDNKDALGHDWENATATWEFNYDAKTATATITCGRENCEHSVEVPDEQIKEETETAANCENDRTFYYTASVEYEGHTFSTEDTVLQTEENSKLGHIYNIQEWSWVGFESATLSFTCSVCEKTKTEPAKVELTTSKAATCEDDGEYIYTATVTFEGETYTSTKGYTIPATGHDWKVAEGDIDWDWHEGYTNVTATFHCSRCTATHEEEAKVTIETVAAKCEEAGKTTYTATVTFNGADYTDTQEVEITATGHSWKVAEGEIKWSWAEDYTSATATFKCSKCSDEHEEPTEDIKKVTVSEATCEADRTYQYEATVSFNENTYTDYSKVLTEAGTATGHSYGKVVWTWADDYSSATATVTCGNDNGHKLTATTEEISSITVEAKCEEAGNTTYTATVTINGKEERTTKEVKIPQLNHELAEGWTSDENGKHYHECVRYEDCHYTSEPEDCTYGGYTSDNDSMHSRTCSYCEYVETTEHTWSEKATSAGESGHKFTCTDGCGATKIEGHTLKTENIGDDYNHRVYCTVEGCEYSTEQAHNFGSGDDRHDCECGELWCYTGADGESTIDPAKETDGKEFTADSNRAINITNGANTSGKVQFGKDGAIIFERNNASTDSRWWNSSGTITLRVYANSTFTVKVGGVITQIEFGVSSGSMSVEEGNGTLSDNTWKGESSSVTFNVTANITFTEITISYKAIENHKWQATGETEAANCAHGKLTKMECIRCGETYCKEDGEKTNNHVFAENADTKYEGGNVHSTLCSVCDEYVEHETQYKNNGEAGHIMSCGTCHWTAEEEHDAAGENGACSKCEYKPKYNVSLDYGEGYSVEQGSATVTPEGLVEAGTEVTVTIIPAEGYKLLSLIVNGANVTDKVQDGEYSFAVIGATTIIVTFAKDKAPEATPHYEKVTSTDQLVDGKYLIVYEDGNVVFDGSRTTLDAANNGINVTITDNKIEASTTVNGYAFTITKSGDNYTILSASGYYIGQTSNANGLASNDKTTYPNTISIDESSSDAIIISGGAYLRYNATSGQARFRYYQSSTYTNQKAIQLYKLIELPCEHEGTIDHIDEVAATCTENGLKEHYKCTKCGKTFSDAQGQTEYTPEVLPAYGEHVVPTEASEYTNNADGTHSYTCSRCEEQVIEGHKYGPDYTCICGDSLVEKVAEAFAQIEDSINNIIIAESPYQLPQLSVAGVEFEWSVEQGVSVAVDIDQNGQLTVKQFPEADTPITIKLKATCGEYSETKDVTVTIVGRPAAGGDHKCGDVCEVCGGCLTNCEESECAKKCDCKPVWTLVENVNQLKENAQVLLVYDKFVNGGLSSTNKYLESVSGVKVSSNKKTIETLPDDAYPLTLGKSGNNWTFAAGSNVIGLSSNANGSMTISGGTTTWTISIANGVAMIASTLADTTNTCRLQCNTNSGQERFTNYKTSTQHDPSIYILAGGSTGGGSTTEPDEGDGGNTGTGSESSQTKTASLTFTSLKLDSPMEIDSVASVTFSKAGNTSTSPAWNANDSGIRVYASNTVTVSVGTNYKITSITLTMKTGKVLEVDVGNWVDSTGVWSANGGSYSSVVFTPVTGSGNRPIQAISVTYEVR